MAVRRKEKESFIVKNLFFLRDNARLTIMQVADLLNIGKSSYYAYEQGRALPDVHKLMKLANYYDVPLEDLLYKNLSSPKKKNNISETVMLYEVEKVPVAARAGYARGFGDDATINKLPTIKIPFKPYGIARAFEIDGDSMEPEIKDGSTVVAIKIGRKEVKDKGTYIVVTGDGLQCKDVSLNGDIIYLISKNGKYPIKHIDAGNVRELWEVWKKNIN